MPAFLTWGLVRKLGPYIAIALAVLAAWWYVSGLQNKVESQAATIMAVQRDLDGERLARKRDVAGLTALSSGLTKAAVETKADKAIMERAIDATNPSPASSALSDLLRQLRASDSSKPTSATGANR